MPTRRSSARSASTSRIAPLCALVTACSLAAATLCSSVARADEAPAPTPRPATASAGDRPATGSGGDAPATASSSTGPRFGFGGGALYVPAGDGAVTAFAAQLALVFPTAGSWETRLIGYGYKVDAAATATTGAMLAIHTTGWAGVYGFGLGGGVGYAKFTKNESGGWDDDSFTVGAYLTPLTLRFGDRPRFEVSANIGAMRFFSHDVRPWGFVGLGLVLLRRVARPRSRQRATSSRNASTSAANTSGPSSCG